MSSYPIRVQVLLDLNLKNKLEHYKDKHGYITDSQAIREIMKKVFQGE